MNSNYIRMTAVLLLITIASVACTGSGVIRSDVYYHRDLYYRNPWNDFDRLRRPIIIAPPPMIDIDPDFGVDPMPEAMPML